MFGRPTPQTPNPQPQPQPQPPDPLELARQELVRRVEAREKLLAFTQLYTPNYHAGWVHHEVAELLDAFRDAVERQLSPRLMIFLPPRAGKALDGETPIPTLRGTEQIKHLNPGDFVIGSDGRPTRVLAVRKWKNRPRYRVTTDDGVSVVADANHEWEVRLCRKHKNFAVHTTEYLAQRTSPRKPMVRVVRTQGEHSDTLPIDPYTLGVWLGDGTSDSGSVTLSREDSEHILSRISAQYQIREQPSGARRSSVRFGVLGLQSALRGSNLLNNKHIPEAYFHVSVQQRRCLLKGIVDTDGYVNPRSGMIEVTQVRKTLAQDVRRLVHSLGVKASMSEERATIDGRDVGPKYRVTFFMRDAASLPRKRQYTRDGTKQPNRYLSFERVEDGDTYCIEVEAPDHLYLCGDGYLLTHNSQLISRLLPPFLLGHNPQWEVVAASATQDLSDSFGRYVRSILNDPTYQDLFPNIELDPSTNSASLIQTKQRGMYKAVGVGGQLTGMGAHVLIIDDPIKDREQADSPTQREALWGWYSAVARTRLHPGGGVIVVHTRWHEDDLAGRLVLQMKENKDADQWKIYSYPAIAKEDEPHRKKGEALHPERYPIETLHQIRNSLIPADWSALYQQDPSPEDGDYFKRDWFDFQPTHKYPPLDQCTIYVSTDLAVSERQTADYSVVWPFAVDSNGDLWFLPNYIRQRLPAHEIVEAILDRVEQYKARGIIIEKGQISNAIKPFLNKRMFERNQFVELIEPAVTKDKQTRARSLQGRMQQRRVHFPDLTSVHEEILPEFLMFPNGKNDDAVDTCAWAALALEQFITPHAPTKSHQPTDEEEWRDAEIALQQTKKKLHVPEKHLRRRDTTPKAKNTVIWMR